MNIIRGTWIFIKHANTATPRLIEIKAAVVNHVAARAASPTVQFKLAPLRVPRASDGLTGQRESEK